MKNILLLSIFILFTISLYGQKNIGVTISKTEKTTVQDWKQFDGNRINATINSAGPFGDYLKTNSAGLEWPKGSGKTAVFTAGMWLIGKHRPSNDFRTAVQDYLSEFQPGPILGIFNTTSNDVSVASNRSDSAYRIYKINKGDNGQTNIDYSQWPGHLGAPYHDVNNNGQWDPGFDTPTLYGEQTLWSVYNDLDTTAHKQIGTTKPMGIEVHATYFGFNTIDALKNTMFLKWKIINKSDAYYDSVFIGIYSDTDMGDANDDVVGFDSALQLTYVYNGDDNDGGSTGYGSSPPACGYMFLNGNPALQLFAHPLILKSSSIYHEPALGNVLFPIHAFNLFRSLQRTTGDPTLNPLTNQPSRFVLTGDPVTGTGWLWSSQGLVSQDVRQFLSIGPTSLAPGDTQEVNAVFIIAQDSNRLKSITLLRHYADTIRKIIASDPYFATSVTMPGRNDMPTNFSLNQNFPNPFNPSTTIRYSIPRQSKVTLTVYNILGQRIKTLVNDENMAGNHSVYWNGRNEQGMLVASGLYIYNITAGSFTKSMKMMLIK